MRLSKDYRLFYLKMFRLQNKMRQVSSTEYASHYGGLACPSRKLIFKAGGSEAFFKHFPWRFSPEKSILGQNQDKALSCLVLTTALDNYIAIMWFTCISTLVCFHDFSQNLQMTFTSQN